MFVASSQAQNTTSSWIYTALYDPVPATASITARVPAVITVPATLQQTICGDPTVAAHFGQITRNLVADTLHTCIELLVSTSHAAAAPTNTEVPAVIVVPDTVQAVDHQSQSTQSTKHTTNKEEDNTHIVNAAAAAVTCGDITCSAPTVIVLLSNVMTVPYTLLSEDFLYVTIALSSDRYSHWIISSNVELSIPVIEPICAAVNHFLTVL